LLELSYPSIPLCQVLTDSARRFPDKPFILYPRELTFGQIDVLSDRLATALTNLEVKKGSVVALFLWNSPEFIISLFGALKAGATVTPMNPTLSRQEFEYQVGDSGSKVVIMDERGYQKMRMLQEPIPTLDTLVLTGNERHKGTRSFKELLKTVAVPPQISIDPHEDLALLMYTSGTTGRPRGCMLTHYNIVSNIVQRYRTYRNSSDEIHLIHLPLYHITGLTCQLLTAAYIGCSIVLQRRFKTCRFLELIERYRATHVSTVMPVVNRLVKYPRLKDYNLFSIRSFGLGGAPVALGVVGRFQELTGIEVRNAYGLTEASPGTHSNRPNKTMLGSVGKPLPDTEQRIVDQETGEKDLPVGEVGELLVRGPQAMKGYWKRPKETAEVIRDGWLHTGDLGSLDEDGYLYIVGRKKDIIKCMGFTIGPSELENVLLQHPAVDDCAVVGKPDRVRGEIPKAFVRHRRGMAVTEEELLKFVEERVARYEMVREIEFVNSIPRTASGKILRRLLIDAHPPREISEGS